MSAEDLKARKARKGVVTRHLNNLEVNLAEEDVPVVRDLLDKLKIAYKEFEAAHTKYHEGVEEKDEEESMKYFLNVQRSYIEAMKPARAWLRNQTDGHDVKDSGHAKPENPNEESEQMFKKTDESVSDLIALLSQPKVELKSFDGNPLDYHCFVALFEESVKSVKDENLKLTRLLQYTSDKAHKAIQSCVLLKDGYERAREILQERYGNDHQVAEMIVNRIRRGKPVRSADEIQDLADELNNSQRTLSQINCLHEVDNQNCISEISKRFDYRIQEKWISRVMDVKSATKAYPDFRAFADFVIQQAQRANDPVYGQSRSRRNDNSRSTSSFTTEVNSSVNPVRFPCVLCKADHKLFGCDLFRSMRPIQRLEVVNKYNLCENCLMSNHTTQMCKRPTRCSVPDCNKKHTKFIHISDWNGASATEGSNGRGNDSIRDGVKMINANVSTNSDVHMPVVAVSVNRSRDVCALLDTGSSNSFITKALVDSLNLCGNVVTYSLNTLSGEQNVKSHAVNVNLSSLDGAEMLELYNVYVVDNIPVLTSTLKVQDYSHFKGLQLVDGGQEVQVLIGQDNAEALIPLEVRRGKKGDPFATRTLFGWSVSGPDGVSSSMNNKVHSNFVSALSVEDNVKQLWEIEEDPYSAEQGMSQEDRKVLDLWAEEMKFMDGHFQLPIPRKDGAVFPNNHSAASSRLTSLVKSLKRKGLMSRYNDEIVKLLDKGYAEPVKEDESSDLHDVWYLPHHPVITDKKPGKLRIVFDCAAKYKGESLNDKCLQGPDLNNKLLHVLLRFRQHEYAFTADIESMYYQVRIPAEQRDVLRFLWISEDEAVHQFRMTGHVFGGVWCASSTSYALRQSLVNRSVDYDVSETILRSFYVDDCLRSLEEKGEVTRIIEHTRSILSDSGFNLTKFMVNNNDILQNIPPEHRAAQAKDLNPSTCSKVLGIKWNVATDEFYFDADVVFESKVTKRSILSVVASMYDPLGFINPLILSGKMMFQEATILKNTWDEELPREFASRWLSWFEGLKNLSDFRIPRCIKPCTFNDAVMELHVFSDSSERAYGSCCYLRLVNKDGLIHTSLLLAKSRVGPRRFVSIPRLELQAAVLSVQLESILKRELGIPLMESYFWTDSEIVLKYISNDSRRFQVFVANRVSNIRQSTDPSQWHHVAGPKNPADLLTRAQEMSTMDMKLWLEGPMFLRSHKCNWNSSEVDPTLSTDDPEVKRIAKERVTTFLNSTGREDPMDKLIEHYSDWNRLIKAVTWLLRVKKILLKDYPLPRDSKLSLSEVRNAETLIVKHAQMKCYSKELTTLATKGMVDRDSSIKELSPLLDENGVIRINGRIKNAQIAIGARQPLLIPHLHPIAKLIARHHHDEAHLGTEWVVSKIREQYWITKIRGAVKSVSRACLTCRKLFAASPSQQMADLPLERVQHGKPYFSSVGMDCFGPFCVKRGRSEVKRYGCLFTCMAIRAVHIEKLDSLDTDSFMNGLRRFISRRGQPEKIFCDNGTNFVGGKAELSRSIKDFDQELIQKYCLSKHIEWVFNPPGASHMGGAWERIIRTIRKVMAGLVPSSCSMSDESLNTLFCEVEGIINGRPLTKCSSDVNDPSPLTPNHLLLMRELPALPPGVFTEADAFRRRWRCVQHYADVFWQRWLKEYIPELQKRSKWLDKHQNLREGDLVLIQENTPRGVWPMGLVTEAYRSADGLVRSVKIRTKSTHLVRPITKVVLLENSSS